VTTLVTCHSAARPRVPIRPTVLRPLPLLQPIGSSGHDGRLHSKGTPRDATSRPSRREPASSDAAAVHVVEWVPESPLPQSAPRGEERRERGRAPISGGPARVPARIQPSEPGSGPKEPWRATISPPDGVYPYPPETGDRRSWAMLRPVDFPKGDRNARKMVPQPGRGVRSGLGARSPAREMGCPVVHESSCRTRTRSMARKPVRALVFSALRDPWKGRNP